MPGRCKASVAVLPLGRRAGNAIAPQSSRGRTSVADCSWSQSGAGALFTQSCNDTNEYSSDSGIAVPNHEVSVRTHHRHHCHMPQGHGWQPMRSRRFRFFIASMSGLARNNHLHQRHWCAAVVHMGVQVMVFSSSKWFSILGGALQKRHSTTISSDSLALLRSIVPNSPTS